MSRNLLTLLLGDTMRFATRTMMVTCALLAFVVFAACGPRYVRAYRAAIAENQNASQNLSLGMSAASVRSLMGDGKRIQYKKIYFIDPWRSESFQLTDGTDVLILYYLTEPARDLDHPTDQDLTPIVLENDQVMGWGWTYLRRNTDRYSVRTPREEK